MQTAIQAPVNQPRVSQPAVIDLSGLPGNAQLHLDAQQIGESEKAIKARLADGREIWVPKSVGRIQKIATRVQYHAERVCPSNEFGRPPETKTVLIVPVWFWRKQAANNQTVK